MKKITAIFVLMLLAVVTLAACGLPPATPEQPAQPEEQPAQPVEQPAAAPETVSIMTLKGPTGVGMAYMMDNSDYDFRVAAAPDEIVAALSSGQADMAAIPTNLAAKLYAKTQGDVVMLALNTYGTLYICENGETVNSLADLQGKQISLAGQGANPQYVLEYLLAQAGVEAELVYTSEHAQTAALLASGEVDIALLPEPNVTATLSKNPQLRVALDCNALWQEATGGNLCLGCVAASREFVEAYPEFVETFLAELAVSVQYALDDVSGAAALCETYEIIPSAAIAEKAIPNCQLCCDLGADMKSGVTGFYEVLLAADPGAIGGALPGDDFYYGAS